MQAVSLIARSVRLVASCLTDSLCRVSGKGEGDRGSQGYSVERVLDAAASIEEAEAVLPPSRSFASLRMTGVRSRVAGVDGCVRPGRRRPSTLVK
jgi:hypothetical protein